ncbi:MAG TPA: undecaprenyldiphospho-muramoylpentapeptide beta-N-acetylglucosaminyltransferase [Flavobacteriaceae bacterium]|nr:undecaprenyldiphospho-muramoylpentapeptide beta-N-acetylglucosaminyltransferase [Flavobacteriaceae bacterium]
MKNLRIIISGGGTGGHIYPAIAIADEIKRRFPSAELLFVGAKNRMEMQKVPKAGYKIEGLWISGIQRKSLLKNASFPLKVIDSLLKSNRILRKFKPHIAIGTGGFASGPLLKCAADRKIPTLIQEQNSHAGITNKWLSKKADKICVAYEGMQKYFPTEKIVFTGNPVRQDLLGIGSQPHRQAGIKEEAQKFFDLKENKKTVLVLGGSLGARRINQLIEKQLETFKKNEVQVIWQTGKFYFEHYKKHENEAVKVYEYLDRMDLTYAAADIIISRAGASSVSELCIVGKPVIFIPSPNVAEDHQTKNAKAISEKNAAVTIRESDLEKDFEPKFLNLLRSEDLQNRLSENIKKMAKPNATKEIVDEVEKLLNQKR